MNRADQEAGNLAVDSLLNYETVKYFNNEKLEADRYEKQLAKYEAASLKTTTSLAFLNWGQNAIFSAAMATTMGMVGYGVMKGCFVGLQVKRKIIISLNRSIVCR